MNVPEITVIGAGLAGCEAAWQAVKRGVKVRLYEMKPHKMTPAHSSPLFAELVCSNSLRSNLISNAVGLLKEELRRLGSLIMEAADASSVSAGSALAVDRKNFAQSITDRIRSHPLIEIVEEEVTRLPESGITIVASGPLTSEELSNHIETIIGCDRLHFFDAAAPIIDTVSIDIDKVFLASRYGKGEASYLNCPFNEDEYQRFYEALITAQTAELYGHEGDLEVFEGCMPIEVMASRGKDTLRFGPMKPIGLDHPVTGEKYYAVVQLRRENAAASMYNIVGFQTRLTFPEQRRVFRMIPGLENAEFLRYGVMHRNTFINSPQLLTASYSMRERSEVYFAGQMTGVEGYVESASSGLAAGVDAAVRALGGEGFIFPAITEIGALAHYISDPTTVNFQPMNANFGIIAPLGYKVKGDKTTRNEEYARRSLEYIDTLSENPIFNDCLE